MKTKVFLLVSIILFGWILPASVQGEYYIAGNFNSWSHEMMTENGDGTWSHTITGLDPFQRGEFKITQGDWSWSFPSGPNSWYYAEAAGEVTVTFDTNVSTDGWMPAENRLGLSHDAGSWTIAGNFFGVGDPRNWNTDLPEMQMDNIGNGIYRLIMTLEPGLYEWKPVVTGTWDSISIDGRSVNTANTVTDITTTSEVKFYVNALEGTMRDHPALTLSVDRGTLEVTLSNNTGGPVNMASYSMTSASCKLDPDAWLSIAGNYDADSGGMLDPIHSWQEDASYTNLLAESEPTGTGITISNGQSIELGAVWIPSSNEDLSLIYNSNGEDIYADNVFLGEYDVYSHITATPNTVLPGQFVAFDGSASFCSDSNRSIVSYEWDFDNECLFDIDDTGVSTMHAYDSVGTYGITLRVTDDYGNIGYDSVEITVVTCFVDLSDFSLFAAHWLDAPCNEGNNYCGGADIDRLGDVNVGDLEILAFYWLSECPDGWGL